MDSNQLQIIPSGTPNPSSTRYAINRTLVSNPAGYDFPNEEAAEKSLLAQELFKLIGVERVFIGPDFVTVTVGEDPLPALNDRIVHTIGGFLVRDEPAVQDDAPSAATTSEPTTDIEKKIVNILETEIRPAVAMDGGDIAFEGFDEKEGVVSLRLKGSCHGCPSSLMTLKMGIESRLKMEIPEVQSVEAV